MRRGATVALSLALLAGSARAADPTKQECIDASESGQDLQRAGKLMDARVKLATCVAASCPGPVRQDCAQRLEELTHAIPTLVLEAKDAAGNDLGSVRVTMDGKAFADRLDGNAVSVDPGEHQFTFQADGYESLDKTVVVRIAEKDRVVRVVLNRAGAGAASASASGQPASSAAVSATATASASPPPSTETPSRGMPGTAWVSFGVGAAGLVVGAIFTGLWASAKSSGDAACGTPGTCTTSTANHWESMQRNDSIGLGVGFGVAAVGIGLGLAFALAHHGGEAPPATARVGVDPNGGSLRIEF